MKLFQYRNDEQRNLDREISKSDRLRATAVGTTFLLIALVVAYLSTKPFPFTTQPPLSQFPYFGAFAVLFGMSLYEFGYQFIQGLFLKKGLRFPWPARFFNAFLEVSVPTFFLWVWANLIPPVEALSLPPLFVYFLLIGMSALRLEPSLSIFTGFVAGLQYFLLSYFFLSSTPSPDLLASWNTNASRAGIILLSGLILAFVAYQIRSRLAHLLRTTEDRNKIAAIFGQHVSPAVVDRLLNQKTSNESETRYVCILFLDIRNFTKYSQDKDPETVVEYLNQLFSFMVECINRNHGIINKFLGDGFMAVFGAPLDDGKADANAIRAGVEIAQKLSELVDQNQIVPTKIGIGIHSGHAVTGNVGSLQRQEYTIIGDVVNLASRIEQLNKSFDSEILVSQTVWDSARTRMDLQFEAEPLGPVTVKGRDEPVLLVKLR